jgi:hypothetical protein
VNLVDIDLTKAIRWPHRCAYCNGEATTEAKTHFRVIDGFFLIAIRETTHSFRYPVCSKHRWMARFYGFFTNQAWPTGFVMVLIVPAFLYLLITLGTGLGAGFGDQLAIALYVLFAGLIIYLKMRNPVKVVGAKKAFARIRFAKLEYAQAFRSQNAA